MSDVYTPEASRRSTRAEMMKRAIADHVTYTLALDPSAATDRDLWRVAAAVDRDERKPTSGEGKPSDHAPLIVTLRD